MVSQPNAQLQHRLILRLARPEPVNSVAELGREVGASRPSASRALHALEQAGLVAQHDARWMLTLAGRDHAGVLRNAVVGRVNMLADETARKMRQQMETIKVADLDHVLGANVARDFAEVQKVVNSRVTQEALRIADSPIAREAIQAMASGWAKLAESERPQDVLRDRLSELTSGALAELTKQAAVTSSFQAMAAQSAAPAEAMSQVFANAHVAVLEEHAARFREQMQAASLHALVSEFAQSARIAEAAASALQFDQHARAIADQMAEEFRVTMIAAAPRISVPELNFPWLKEWAEQGRVQDAFAAADLVPAPSMDASLRERVVAAHQAGVSPEAIMDIVLEEYDADDCARTKLLVERLCASEDFAERRPLLEQVFAAHRQGFDALTVYSLVPMIEGVMSAFIFEHWDEPRWPRHNDLAAVLDELPASLASAVGWAAYSRLVDFFQDRLYKGADWKTEDPQTRTQHLDLNRHRFLHGLATQGTRAHTVRCLLVLETIAVLLPAIRSLMEEAAAAKTRAANPPPMPDQP